MADGTKRVYAPPGEVSKMSKRNGGDMRAIAAAAKMLRERKGEPFPPTMVNKLERLYEQGNAKAAVLLGAIQEWGLGVPVNHQRALQYNLQAAEWGSPIGVYNIGIMLAQPENFPELFPTLTVPERKQQAIQRWQQAAELEETYSLVCLGIAYEKGEGVPQDELKGTRYYLSAAGKGNSEGMLRLALCYRDGIGVAANANMIQRYLKQAAKRNHPVALYELGRLSEEKRHPSKPVSAKNEKYFQRAADLGYPHAVEWCGSFYTLGPRPDFKKGLRYLKQALQAGSIRAKYVMAVLLAKGIAVEKDSKKAYELCLEAAESGESDAQYMLGLMLQRGDGVPRNETEATDWIRRAAANGNERAKQKCAAEKNRGGPATSPTCGER